MAESALGRRYARALVSLGQEAGCIERIDRDLSAFAEVMDLGGGALRGTLISPSLTTVERGRVLDEVLKHVSLHPFVRNLLRLLNDKSRFFIFDDIRRAYTELADELAGRVRATVTTARPLGLSLRAQVQAALTRATGKDVVVGFEVDSELIGGIVARVGDKVYDASVRARLQEMEHSLLSGEVAEA